ncbi:hypothetical protein [Roseospira visakhapatnamensis]|uniref:Uncharacterized protein n=1 Tax=Roseospira visakhapatnamensis TaxID=390880 RepID=A0A7W6WBK1_9PROT|nr:hypothetical protein [Roseospira visakhapatnamensis]MBB4267918.1 hypothetical protein [Roseospira visakhapatnamensis]
MAAFLSTELAARKVALGKKTGRKVSMARLLHEVALTVDLDPMISEETLRRFVVFEEEQAPRPGTLAAIAAYLVAVQGITRADLDAVAAADPARLGVLRPMEPRANAEAFAKELAGEYRGYRLSADRLVETRLTLAFDSDARRIDAAHRVRAYAVSAPEQVPGRTLCLHPARFEAIAGFTRNPPVVTAVQYGGLFADIDLAFAVGLARGQEAGTLLSFDRILFHEDMPHALTGRRSGRWKSGDLEDLDLPGRATREESGDEENVADPLAGLFDAGPEDIALFRRAPHVRVKRHGSRPNEDRREEKPEDKPGPGALGFAPLADADIDDEMLDAIERAIDRNAEECARVRAYFAGRADPSEKLATAIDSFQVEEGVKTIEAGADINARHPRTGEPLIFAAASWSMASLIRAMLATGKLDLSVRDGRSKPPSRRVADPDLFAELCAAELEQRDD